MKYVDADKIKAEIDNIINSLKNSCNPNPLGTTEECLADAEIEALNLVKDIIDKMKQEEPTQALRNIEEESKTKGWLDYGLMVSEIGLHRYNAIHRIKEHKEKFDPLSIPNLYHIAEYYEAVGAEITCCCLQRYCMDFRFDQEDVMEIIRSGG